VLEVIVRTPGEHDIAERAERVPIVHVPRPVVPPFPQLGRAEEAKPAHINHRVRAAVVPGTHDPVTLVLPDQSEAGCGGCWYLRAEARREWLEHLWHRIGTFVITEFGPEFREAERPLPRLAATNKLERDGCRVELRHRRGERPAGSAFPLGDLGGCFGEM